LGEAAPGQEGDTKAREIKEGRKGEEERGQGKVKRLHTGTSFFPLPALAG